MNKKREKNENSKPFSLKNIIAILVSLGVIGGGGGLIGYNQNPDKEVVVQNVDVKDVIKGIYDNQNLLWEAQKQRDKAQNDWIQGTIDEFRTSNHSIKQELRSVKNDIKDDISDLRDELQDIKQLCNDKNLANEGN